MTWLMQSERRLLPNLMKTILKSMLGGESSRNSSNGSKGPNFDRDDPKQKELHVLYSHEPPATEKRGTDLLHDPYLNKGTAFTLQERQVLGIHGLLPPAFLDQEQQALRIMRVLKEAGSDLERYMILEGLHERNCKLFYYVVSRNIKELLPIVYTPTVGLACQKYGYIYRNPKGLYITINDNSVGKIYQILSNWPTKDIQAIVVTDGERILGLGDLGTYGIGIPIGKLHLYVGLAGIRPEHCLPVCIDVGTDNEKLRNDPFYTGLPKKRVRGQEYDTLLDNFMIACTKRFGQDTLIQFEDFGNSNAFRLLHKYQNKYCTFNDDIQGTAAVVTAGLLSSNRITKNKLADVKIVFYGAGGASIGVAELCMQQMREEGLSEEEALERIFMIDSKGLITKSRLDSLTEQKKKYAKDKNEMKELIDVVKEIKPQAIIGLSTIGGAFSEEVIKEMAKINERPIIFALSNPTDKSECTAEEAYKHTEGKAIFASGSPFKDVKMNGKTLKPGQGNNSYIFPGIALACVMFKLTRVPNKFFLIAARTLAEAVNEKSLNEYSRIYPRLSDCQKISVKIATEIGKYAYAHNLASFHPEPENKELFILEKCYNTEYEDLLQKGYDWPEQDMKRGAGFSQDDGAVTTDEE